MPQKRMEYFRLLFDHLAWIKHQFLSGIRASRKVGNLWGMMRGVEGVRKSIHQSWLAKGSRLGLRFFREFRKRLRRERLALFKSGQWHFLLDNALVHNSILVTDYLSKMGINTVSQLPYSPDLAVTFGYSLSTEAVVVRQFKRGKRMWRRSLTRPHKRNSMGPSRSCWNGTTSVLQPDEITSTQTKWCNYVLVLVCLGLVLWHINLCRLFNAKYCLVGWGCRIHRLRLGRGVRHVVHRYSNTDTTAAWKKTVLSNRSDFHMTNSLSKAVHAFASHVLMSFSVNEIQLFWDLTELFWHLTVCVI